MVPTLALDTLIKASTVVASNVIDSGVNLAVGVNIRVDPVVFPSIAVTEKHCNLPFIEFELLITFHGYARVRLPIVDNARQIVLAPDVVHRSSMQSPAFVAVTVPVTPTVVDPDPTKICWLAF